ncbi:MAG: DUF4340 domain-containing protein [Xanthomonadales bacterium]|nr:DUF4340 domain-containing protein [Xanthomonadales bacterium]
MSKKHFSWLLVATLVVGALIFILPGGTSKDSEFQVQLLLPDLAGWANNIDRVQVKAADNQTAAGQIVATLKRQDDAWVMEEFHDYPADWPKLRELLSALAKARIIEPKTNNAEYFSRLGVSDISNEDSQAMQIQLQSGDGTMAVLIGNAAEGREGQYVRLVDGDQALLIDQQLNLPAEAKDWLQRDLIDVSDAEVVEFSVVHADGAELKGSKTSADDDDFSLQDVPEGREVLSAWSVNSIANALATLQLDSVAPAATVDFSAATQFRLLTADGLQVLAELAEFEEQQWLRISASAYESDGAAETTDTANTDAAEEAKDDVDNASGIAVAEPSEADQLDQTERVDAKERAATINQRVSGWAYRIPSFKADAMNKRMEDLLKALPANE